MGLQKAFASHLVLLFNNALVKMSDSVAKNLTYNPCGTNHARMNTPCIVDYNDWWLHLLWLESLNQFLADKDHLHRNANLNTDVMY